MIVNRIFSTSVNSTVQIETLTKPCILMIRAENGCQTRDLFVAQINGQPCQVARTVIRVFEVNLTQILFKGNKIKFELAEFSSYPSSS